MSDILDNPNEPQYYQSTRLAAAIRIIESLSIVMLFASLLLTLQSWPFGLEARLISYCGLAMVYLGLFTMRLAKLRKGLTQAQYFRLLLAGISLGAVFFAGAILLLSRNIFYHPILVWVGEILRLLEFIGVWASLFFSLIQPTVINSLSDVIYAWLSTRLWVVAVIGLLTLVSVLR